MINIVRLESEKANYYKYAMPLTARGNSSMDNVVILVIEQENRYATDNANISPREIVADYSRAVKLTFENEVCGIILIRPST